MGMGSALLREEVLPQKPQSTSPEESRLAQLVSESFGPADSCDASVLAIDLALLLPPDADALARRLNQTLATDPDALRLDDAHLPQVTVAQLFIAAEDLDNVRERVMPAVAGMGRLRLHVRGIARGSSAWMEIERTAELQQLHERWSVEADFML